MGVREPAVLILASRFDLSVDYMVAKLRTMSVEYLRLNTEDCRRLSWN